MVRDEHGAEEAFQATFLALARKAGSIRRTDALGGWLYRVAWHAAHRVRAKPTPTPDSRVETMLAAG